MDANTFLVAVGMIAMVFIQWRSGANKAGSETVAMYKARDEVQDKENKRKDEQITKMTHDLGVATGKMEEMKERIKTLEQVDISRNPVLLQFMERMNKVADESVTFMNGFKELPHILGNINTSMGLINDHMAKNA